MNTVVVTDVPHEHLSEWTTYWREHGWAVRQLAPQSVAPADPDGLSRVRVWTVVLVEPPF